MREIVRYSPEDDELILSTCEEAKKAGRSLTDALKELSEVLGRPVKSIENKYRRLTRPNKFNNLEYLTESERLKLKLKSIARDKKRNAEKVEEWKNKYQEASKRNKQLEKELNEIKKEHEELLKLVHEIVDEDQSEVS